MADLRDWRQEHRFSLDRVAGMLGLSGRNPARTIHRIETGESAADADLVEAIGRITDGAVTASDLHQVRLRWLRETGRDRAFVPDVPPEADGTVTAPGPEVIAQDEEVCP